MTKKTIGIVLGVIIIAGLVAGGIFVYQKNHKNPQPTVATTVTVEAVKTEPKLTLASNMLYVGEVFWGRGVEYYAKRSPLGYAFPFSGLTAADKQEFDAWIGDMECPITDKDIPYQTQVDSLLFNCRPEYVAEAAKWFDVFTLANNHTDNNGGVWGMDQTRQNLETAKIQYFGDYNMRNTTNICDVIAMPAQLPEDSGPPQQVTMPMALCGYDYVGNVVPQQAEFDVIKQYAAVMPVIAMPHAGVEYRPTAEDSKVAIYRKLIDSGADIVIGAHPHVVQNSENYKGRLIVYSTGNFMFDQQPLGKDTILSLGVGLNVQVTDTAAINAYKSATNCQTWHDDCLAQLSTKITKRPVITVSYDSRCFEQSTNVPKKANQSVCDDILNRATWKTATTGLATTW